MRRVLLNLFNTAFFAEFNHILFDSLVKLNVNHQVIKTPEDIDPQSETSYLFYPCFGVNVNGNNVGNGLQFDVTEKIFEQINLENKSAKIFLLFSERIEEIGEPPVIRSPMSDLWNRIERMKPYLDGLFCFSRYYHNLFKRHDFPSTFLPIGFHPKYGDWEESMTSDGRSIEVLHLGHVAKGDRRYNILEKVKSMSIDLKYGIDLWATERNKVLRNTKIVVNLHYDVTGNFEWDRFLLAIHNGCIIVSEKIADPYPFEPGKHYIEASPEELPQVIANTLENYEDIYPELKLSLEEIKKKFSFFESYRKMINIITN